MNEGVPKSACDCGPSGPWTWMGAIEPGSVNPDCRVHGSVERWVIRKRFSFMYGSPGFYWRVSHSSLPAYFGHALHLDSWEDAIEYACAHAKAVA